MTYEIIFPRTILEKQRFVGISYDLHTQKDANSQAESSKELIISDLNYKYLNGIHSAGREVNLCLLNFRNL